MKSKLYVVIPCYNEEEVLPETAYRLEEKIRTLIEKKQISQDSRILFINDGSKDNTWELITELYAAGKYISGINLSRNRGHQNALLAGIMYAKDHADMIISMDADLQDDIHAIDEMIDRYKQGFDIVYGVRSSRDKDTIFKKITAEGFYHFMDFLGANTIFNHADYRLMSRRAAESLSEYKEVNLFLRGMVPMVGYPSAIVYYERNERFAGESKYPLKKMISFAIEGITSLSIKPIRMITHLGTIIFLISVGILVYSLLRHFTGHTTVGWTSIMVSIWAIGGLILLSLGILGEYIGKIYLETKERPRYHYERILDNIEKQDTIHEQ